jgi:hypothetical protein
VSPSKPLQAELEVLTLLIFHNEEVHHNGKLL